MAEPDQNEPALKESSGHLSGRVEMDHWLRLLVVTATILLLLALATVAVRLLSSIGHTILLFALGGLVAYALDPLVEWLRRERTEKSVRIRSVLIVFGGLILVLIISGSLLGASLGRQLGALALDHSFFQQGQLPNATKEEKILAANTYEAQAEKKIALADRWLAMHNIHMNLEKNIKRPIPSFKTIPNTLVNGVIHTVGNIGRTVVESGLALLISLYFLIYSEELRVRTNKALPLALRPYASQWQDDVNHILGGFVRGQLILALVLGIMGGGLCLVLGLHLWLLIGLFVMVASLIPVIGPYIGAIPAVLDALIAPSWHFLTPTVRVVIVILFFLVINEFGSKILYPKLVGAALGLHEVLVLFVLFAGLEVSGITGMFFAAPLTALTIATLPQLYRLWQGSPPISLSASARSSRSVEDPDIELPGV